MSKWGKRLPGKKILEFRRETRVWARSVRGLGRERSREARERRRSAEVRGVKGRESDLWSWEQRSRSHLFLKGTLIGRRR